jgi:hypothetical protein
VLLGLLEDGTLDGAGLLEGAELLEGALAPDEVVELLGAAVAAVLWVEVW